MSYLEFVPGATGNVFTFFFSAPGSAHLCLTMKASTSAFVFRSLPLSKPQWQISRLREGFVATARCLPRPRRPSHRCHRRNSRYGNASVTAGSNNRHRLRFGSECGKRVADGAGRAGRGQRPPDNAAGEGGVRLGFSSARCGPVVGTIRAIFGVHRRRRQHGGQGERSFAEPANDLSAELLPVAGSCVCSIFVY